MSVSDRPPNPKSPAYSPKRDQRGVAESSSVVPSLICHSHNPTVPLALTLMQTNPSLSECGQPLRAIHQKHTGQLSYKRVLTKNFVQAKVPGGRGQRAIANEPCPADRLSLKRRCF